MQLSLERLQKVNAIAGRTLPDGREILVIRRIFNTILTIGPAFAAAYDDHW